MLPDGVSRRAGRGEGGGLVHDEAALVMAAAEFDQATVDQVGDNQASFDVVVAALRDDPDDVLQLHFASVALSHGVPLFLLATA